MIDAQSAVQDAVFAALDRASAVTGLADVWQDPPEDTQPGDKGLVIIGLVSIAAGDLKSGDLDTATVSVFTQTRKTDARVLYTLNAAVRNALEDQVITAAGAEIGRPVFLSADPKLMEDGKTYEDELKFEMFVQAAD
jgi:hypothetical protein